MITDVIKNEFKLKKNVTKNDALIKVYYKKGIYLLVSTFKIEIEGSKITNFYRVNIFSEKDYEDSKPLN
jgi:hypothetical protein